MRARGWREALIHNDQRPPLRNRWPIAFQAAVAVAIPVIVFTAAGETGLGLQAGIGAFTALYAGALPVRERLKVLPLIAGGFVLAGLLGVVVSAIAIAWPVAGSIATAAGLVLVAVGATALLQGFAVGPPGPVFFALVFGASAHITAPVDGSAPVDPALYLVLLSGGTVFAIVVTASSTMLPSASASARATRPPRRLREILPGPSLSPTARTAMRRATAVAVLGSLLALAVDVERGYWVVCAGLAVVGAGQFRRAALKRGVERAGGTIVGTAVYAGIALLSPGGYLLAVILGSLQFVVELLVVRYYGLALVFITPLALTIAGAAVSSSDPLIVAGERIIDTLVGVTVAIMAALLFHDPPAQPSTSPPI